jgi:hypothetical protein
VHLILDKNLKTRSLLQHITSKNTSNVFTYNIVKSWLKHEADRCHFLSNMFRILRIHHQGVTLSMVEVADVLIRGNCANSAKAGSGSALFTLFGRLNTTLLKEPKLQR